MRGTGQAWTKDQGRTMDRARTKHQGPRTKDGANQPGYRWSLFLAVLLSVPIALAAQASRQDFVRGVEIRTDGTNSVYRILLPDEVYDTSTRVDLADMRVLNAAGETVPYTFRTVPRGPSQESEWQTVPGFPMTETQTGPARTQVKVGADGAVLEVTGAGARGRVTSAYLIDASRVKTSIARVALGWDAPPGVTFLAPVTVFASDDLNSWRTVVASAAIAQLQRDTYTLTQNQIALPLGDTRVKYFKISWPKDLAAVTLTSVRVQQQQTRAALDIRWRTLSADRVEPPSTAHYDTHAVLPVAYVDLDFADPTDAATVTMRTRPATESVWVTRYSGLFYALQNPNGSIRSSYAQIPPTADRYWTLETTREGGWKQNRAPRLKVGWHPREIVFVARGAAPYLLVYGSARVGPADGPVDEIIARLNESGDESRVGVAALGEPRTLGGAEALKPAPTPLPWKQIVLWGVLILAVTTLAFVAARLFRDTKQNAA
jgi:Protein of unknown function (DUF3999)